MTNQTKSIRQGTKLATVVSMLKAENGATLNQIIEQTGWQKHTARGTFSNLKKSYGLTVTSEKPDDKDRVYRIVQEATEKPQELVQERS